jgi:hypothetical protein
MVPVVTLLFSCSGSVEESDRAAQVGDPQLLAAEALPERGIDALVLGATPRNLLVISVDTTRRDRVGLLSDYDDTTPNFDVIFSDGVILADHRSCSNWTAPSSYCAQSGTSTSKQTPG